MKRSVFCLVAALLSACSDDTSDPAPDAGGACEHPALAALSASEKRWKELAADGGDTYWYEHENCVINAPQGQLFVVQVDAGNPRAHSTSAIERSACEMILNAYDSVGAKTFEQLYAMCRELLRVSCDTEFVTDDRGVLRTCQRELSNCQDNCGEGVHIRRWDFGQAP